MRGYALPVGSLSTSAVAYVADMPAWVFVALIVGSVLLGVIQATFPQESADRRDLWLAVLAVRSAGGWRR